MPGLNEAIQFIQQGRKEEARKVLEPLIKTEPGNIQAWFWYVETFHTTEKRLQILEVCLKMNPGNSQVIQALQTLKSQRVARPEFTPPPVQPPKPVVVPQQQKETPSYAYSYDDEPASPPSSYQDAYFNNAPEPVRPQQVAAKQKTTWKYEADAYVDNSMLSKSKRVARSYTFINAWTTVLLSTDIESYEDVLDDPEAGAGRAFEWIAYASIISGLVFPLSLLTNPQFAAVMEMPEFRQTFGNTAQNTFFLLMLTLAMMVISPILSVIGLAISSALYNFLAGMFGGNGNYGRTAYALAAYMAPVGILSSILIVIPFVGQCLTSVLGFYNLFLTVRALRAAHSLSTGKALGVIFAPTIILMIFGCLMILITGLPALGG